MRKEVLSGAGGLVEPPSLILTEQHQNARCLEEVVKGDVAKQIDPEQ